MLSIFARLPLMHRALITLLSVIIIASLFLPAPIDLRQSETVYQIGQAYPIEINSEQLSIEKNEPTYSFLSWEEYKIGPGDSMALLFQRAGLSSRLLYELTSTSKEIQEQLTKIGRAHV